MQRNRAVLGAEGEKRAARYLEQRGYRIVGRNVRADRVEIDLIAWRARILVFVEVKTRQSQRYGAAELAVDARKQARLVRGAQAWLHSEGARTFRYRKLRFDVVACEWNGSGDDWSIRHWPAAFDASSL